MVRFLLDKFRTVPGPLKQARIVAADLAEELLDLGRHFLERRRDGADAPEPWKNPSYPAEPPPSVADQPQIVDAPAAPDDGPPKPKRKKGGKSPATELELPDVLAAAVEIPANLRKQDFKILAILWDAGNRELGPMSAKGISQHGLRIGIPIRHENVRKVIRSRLEKRISVHTEVVGNGTVYRYEINPDGKFHFEHTFLGAGD
ncbi:MAG TPA: hypothetical protein VM285_01615 [Polyangia bacterium]|nr:hypothetical protein [Polyangia bacterium]